MCDLRSELSQSGRRSYPEKQIHTPETIRPQVPDKLCPQTTTFTARPANGDMPYMVRESGVMLILVLVVKRECSSRRALMRAGRD